MSISPICAYRGAFGNLALVFPGSEPCAGSGRQPEEDSMNLRFFEGVAERNRDGVLLLARILLAAIFIQSGFGKLSHFAAFADSMTGKGLPLPFLWALAGVAAEFFGSLCILFGIATRLIAALMVV